MNSFRTRAWIAVLLVGFFGFVGAVEGKVVYVAKTGNDANNGLSWTTAKLTVQAGLNASASTDQVWVAAGTYVERITLKADVALYGGFAGSETDFTQRNWAVNKAILDGNAQGTVVTSPLAAGSSTRIDGFTIRNGKAASGGGINCTISSPTIENNIITNNTISSNGGGIYCESSAPTITHNTITGNKCVGTNDTAGGAGIACRTAPATITENSITGNIASISSSFSYGRGGGIYCHSASAVITRNTIEGNIARGSSGGYGGGIYCLTASPVITENTVRGNGTTLAADAITQASGIYCDDHSNPTIANNAITANGTALGGIAINCYWFSSPLITNNKITSNTGVGISCYRYSLATITGNTIANNAGSGIACLDNSAATIANNAIIGNVVPGLDYTSTGGGVYCSGSSPVIVNNTITNNAALRGGGVGCVGGSPSVVNNIVAFNSSGVYSLAATPSVRRSCVYGNVGYNYSGLTDPTGTNGNISADPRLAGASYGNVHIRPDSPCIDAGDGSVVQSGWVDLDWQARLVGSAVDMGADEFDGTVWPEEPATVVRVSSAGNDAGDGSSWASAKRTVQAAIDAAAEHGGDVWVMEGTYPERITLRPYIHIYGGFAGTETECQQRNWRTHVSILDGQYAGSVVTVTQSGLGLSIIDGFTIRNGDAQRGGGVYCTRAAPTIANNRITGSSRGGGICCEAAIPTITNNVIVGNLASTSYDGGGVYCVDSAPIIANTVIAANSARSGGGIFCSNSAPLIVNDTILGNNARYGGAIYCTSASSPTIANTIIAFNSSGLSSPNGAPSLRFNCVYGNAAYDYLYLATDPTGSNGNISADPMLAAASYGDMHILPGSPCRDAGDDSAVQSGWTDIDGEIRPMGAHADIGADESDGTDWPTGPLTVVRVSLEGNDANDGSSWSSAKRTVPAAVEAAALTGGDVWVKAGSYGASIVMKPFVHVYGGFAGVESMREQRDWHANPSILDGSFSGPVVSFNKGGYRVNTLDGMVVRNGQASLGGGILCDSSSPTIENNTVTANSASWWGGGIYSSSSSPSICGNTITGNSAKNGGGIYCDEGTIAGNTISRNHAASSDGLGGGICCGDALILSNAIAGNTAASGGGIYSASASPTIVNSAIVGNTASNGGGVYLLSSKYTPTPKIVNSTIAANIASELGGGILGDDCRPLVIANTIIAFNSSGIFGTYFHPNMKYNNVFGNGSRDYSGYSNPTGTNGNISADPKFVRPANAGADGIWGTADDDYGNLHVQAGSLCIDGGDNGAVPVGIVTDLDGLSRFLDDLTTADTGLGTPPIVDMGAYERVFVDFDADGDVDADDMESFMACLSAPAIPFANGCGKANFDGDNDVDQNDFGIMQRCYSGSGNPVDPACAQ